MEFEELNDKTDEISFADIAMKQKKKKTSLYMKDGRSITYDKRTMEYYRVLRKCRIDPITGEEVKLDNAFKFEHQWDPYTGERGEKDPYGPLYFDPDYLIHYFYTNRLRNLWVSEEDDTSGYYEGYFDVGVGAGDNFYISSRGHHPEWYLFRLPVTDIYLQKGHSEQIITMGPKLTDLEIENIDMLSKANENNYKKIFKKQRPSLVSIKYYYDISIKKARAQSEEQSSREAVMKLRQM